MPFFSGKEIQQRWTNLRTCFQRELKEQKKGISGQAAKKKRKYVYFDQLLFLVPVCEERETGSNLEPPESCQAEEDPDTYSTCAEQTFRPPPVPLSNPRNERAKKSSKSYEQALLDILKEKAEKAEEIDEDKNFALSIVPALKRMPLDMKMEAKMEIMRVLHSFSRPAPQYLLNPQRPTYQSYQTQPGAGFNSFGNENSSMYYQHNSQRSSTPVPSSVQSFNHPNNESQSQSSHSSNSSEFHYNE